MREDIDKFEKTLIAGQTKVDKASAIFCETVLITAFKSKGSRDSSTLKTGVQKIMGDLAGGKYRDDLVHPRLIEEASSMLG